MKPVRKLMLLFICIFALWLGDISLQKTLARLRKTQTQAAKYDVQKLILEEGTKTYKVVGSRFLETQSDLGILQVELFNSLSEETVSFFVWGSHIEFRKWNDLKFGDLINLEGKDSMCLDALHPMSKEAYVYPKKL